MKKGLHPTWLDCTVTCACGNTFTTRATTSTLQVDICHKCHPFFTGEQRFVDKEGRLEKFQKKTALSAKLQQEAAAKRAAKKAKKDAARAQSTAERKSFKQILGHAKTTTEQADQAAKQAAKTAA
jgi:large subunit ribosomal protein L31